MVIYFPRHSASVAMLHELLAPLRYTDQKNRFRSHQQNLKRALQTEACYDIFIGQLSVVVWPFGGKNLPHKSCYLIYRREYKMDQNQDRNSVLIGTVLEQLMDFTRELHAKVCLFVILTCPSITRYYALY